MPRLLHRAVPAGRWLLIVLFAWHAPGALAVHPGPMTDAEIALTPPYCRDTMFFAGYGDKHGNTSPRAAYWVRLMGEGFWAMHHYCWTVVYLMRAARLTTTERDRQFAYLDAYGDLSFAIENGIKLSGPNFVLLPELYVKFAENFRRMKKDGEALAAYRKAIAAKPDY